jgi:16S rRNA (guanine527-N7)-methyltransferase
MTATLQENLAKNQLSFPEEQIALIDRYCQALWDWNSRLNLTRHTDYDRFVSRDLRDTVELAALLKPGEEVLDIGSGGGVPGLLLAILRPDLQVSLSESIGKKAEALSQMVAALELPVAVHACRGEALVEDLRFDTLVARAVGPLDTMLVWFKGKWQHFGRLLVIKGPRWLDEKTEAARRGLLRGLELNCLAHYPLPDSDQESVILEIRRPVGG